MYACGFIKPVGVVIAFSVGVSKVPLSLCSTRSVLYQNSYCTIAVPTEIFRKVEG